jgi:hypothetical protein
MVRCKMKCCLQPQSSVTLLNKWSKQQFSLTTEPNYKFQDVWLSEAHAFANNRHRQTMNDVYRLVRWWVLAWWCELKVEREWNVTSFTIKSFRFDWVRVGDGEVGIDYYSHHQPIIMGYKTYLNLIGLTSVLYEVVTWLREVFRFNI